MSVLETLAAWYSMSPKLVHGFALALVLSVYYAVYFECRYRKDKRIIEELLKGSDNGSN